MRFVRPTSFFFLVSAQIPPLFKRIQPYCIKMRFFPYGARPTARSGLRIAALPNAPQRRKSARYGGMGMDNPSQPLYRALFVPGLSAGSSGGKGILPIPLRSPPPESFTGRLSPSLSGGRSRCLSRRFRPRLHSACFRCALGRFRRAIRPKRPTTRRCGRAAVSSSSR